MRISFILLIVAGFIAFSHVSHAQQTPPSVYRDRHICPGEGCDYRGNAKVIRGSPAYAAAGSTNRLFTLKAGETVRVLDSEVYTRAGRYVVKHAFQKYRPGDVIWVYTYLGEGFFRVWHKGRIFEQDLAFSPWGGSSGNRCQSDDKNCFGELEREADMKWWLKVRSKSGRIGWIIVTDQNLDWPEKG